MQLYPAIDLRDGRCVRLYQGDFARETVYGDDPVGQARRFADAGSPWIHVVDLDAARTGVALNRSVVREIAAAVAGSDGGAGGGALVQTGGGVRDREAAEALLGAGVARVVVGTAALEDPSFVRALAGAHPGRVAVGLDARFHAASPAGADRWEVAVRGWEHGSGRDLLDVAQEFDDAGVAALIVTEIGRDGTLSGPDLEGLAKVLEVTRLDVVASGGVGGVDDLRTLAGLQAGGRGLAGAIVGRALYEGRFTIEEALAATAPATP